MVKTRSTERAAAAALRLQSETPLTAVEHTPASLPAQSVAPPPPHQQEVSSGAATETIGAAPMLGAPQPQPLSLEEDLYFGATPPLHHRDISSGAATEVTGAAPTLGAPQPQPLSLENDRHFGTAANEEQPLSARYLTPKKAPPGTMEVPPPIPSALPRTRTLTAGSRTSKASKSNAIRIARAKFELAAARVALLEAEAAASDEEGSDVRTVVSEEDRSHHISTWLSEHQEHLTVATNRDCGTWEARPPPALSSQPPQLKIEEDRRRRPLLPSQLQADVLPSRQQVIITPPPQIMLPPQQHVSQPVTIPHEVAATLPLEGLREDFKQLATVIKQQHRPSLGKFFSDLPDFEGSHHEWLTFRAAYNETAGYFTEVENTARLRKVLKGEAAEAVKKLLLHTSNPQKIMASLEERYGRKDSIASEELAELRQLPKPSDTPRDICIFAGKVTNAVAALQALKQVHYLYNPEIAYALAEKLPASLRYRWYAFAAAQPEEEPHLVKIKRFLAHEARLQRPFAKPEPAPPLQAAKRDQPAARRDRKERVNISEYNRTCPACNSTNHHEAMNCEMFKSKQVDERWDLAKKMKLCFRCLRIRHKKHFCKGKRCGEIGCTSFHHKLLHDVRNDQSKTELAANTGESVASASTGSAYLKIAPVTVSGPAGDIDAWALLDDGSTVTLIDKKLADKLGASGPVEPLYINTVGGERIDSSQSRRVTLTLAGERSTPHELQLRTIEKLKLSPQKVALEDLQAPHLKDMQYLAGSGTPQILIGQDNWHLLMNTKMRKGRRDQPVASLTPLGWVIHGAARHKGHSIHFVAHLSEEDSIDEQLRAHFAIENLGITPKTPKNDPERRAEEILKSSTLQRSDGYYETALLWKQDNAVMPYNYDTALKRLVSVEKKIRKEPLLECKYRQQMNELLAKQYAERAPPEKTTGRTWYLPHFAVVNALKPGKLRIVHDAAAKTQGKSLNDFLLTGPDLLQSLPGVLMRFRQHPVAVSADIQEMFMRVKIRAEDRDALRYLWRDKPEDQPQEFRMTSLIFGATSSPATAIYVKNLNAKKYENEFPEASVAIVRSHYMDDYLGSYKTEEEALRIAREVRDIHAHAKFHLRKWTSNSQKILQSLTEETPDEAISITGGHQERVLGLVWRPKADVLTFNLDLARVPQEMLLRETPTKREALKIVMSIYDPLGYASPVTVQGKKMLQEMWRRGTTWDSSIDADLSTQWTIWMTHLQGLREITIPRCYVGFSNAVSVQLHTFVDASESAYAAALYWRIEAPGGRIHTSLVLAKARVAPVKLTSIPRLELQAAVMGSRMAQTVTEEHDVETPVRRFFWTDSRTALTWLKTGSRSYKPFVAHRIAAIEDCTSLSEWRWIPTKINVADDATRDVPQDFGPDHRWYKGPDFLCQPEECWPADTTTPPEQLTGEERCNATRPEERNYVTPDPERFSKWEKYLRSTARVLQFIDRCRINRQKTYYKKTRKSPEKDPTWTALKQKDSKLPKQLKTQTSTTMNFAQIPADTLQRAEKLIWQRSQCEAFQEELKDLHRGRHFAKDSRLRRLAVTLEDGLIRLKNRIGNVTDVEAAQYSPLILDGNRHETKLLLHYIHRRLHHAGVETVINECRQRYWVLRLRPVTKMVLHACLPCRIRKDVPPQPSTGDLPSCRLAHHKRPFSFVGMDYFGPLSTVTGRTVNKRWVAIFCCMTSRAIHLEPAASLSTDSAVMALRRMIARRGTPIEIWSDNGTNLRGADRELRKAMDRATEEEASKKMIAWKFLPPGAPFMGGAWERLVRTVKTALAATEQPRRPTDEVLATLLAEAEYSVNSRPLTHISTSADDPEALTPNHFLLGGSALMPAPGTFTERDIMDRASWRASQRLADIFWTRWVREYLPELQNRREPHSKGPEITIGNLVLIADGNLPRNTWPRGVVIATYPGKDGITRTVDVKTKGGVLRRPVKKLVLIPTEAVLHQGCSDQADAARREDVPDGNV